jgi:MFS family permease
MMEAGMFPGIMAQLNSWYRSEDMGKAIMWFFAIQNAAGIVGSLLVYGISYMNGVRGLSAWRWYVPIKLYVASLTLLQGIYPRRHNDYILFRNLLVRPARLSQITTELEMAYRTRAKFIDAQLSENAPRTKDKFFDRR